MENGRIDIKSEHRDELCTKVVVDQQCYIVETGPSGNDESFATSKIYMDGKIISAQRHNLRKSLDALSTEKLNELMEWHHQDAVEKLKEHTSIQVMASSYYLDEANTLILRKNFQNALGVLAEGLQQYPEDPLLISFYGYAIAKVHGDYKEGIQECWRAIKILEKTVPSDVEFVYPTPFLNLGRAYLEANDRKSAIEVFSRVLHFDKQNHAACMAMKSLGERRKPMFPFLKRSNPLNKYTGKFLRWIGDKTGAC